MVWAAAVRREYLVDGRRVRVSDLVDAKLLPPDARISFRRTRIGDEYEAFVTEDGRIAAGGETHATPSGAAVSLIGSPIDGWVTWQLDDGRSLDDVCQEFLEAVYAEDGREGAVPDDADRRRTRHAFLKEAREKARSGQPERVSVAVLLAQWGATARDSRTAEAIEADLANHGLVTDPPFMSVGRESSIALHLARDLDTPDESITDDVGLTDSVEVKPTKAAPRLDHGVTLGNFEAAGRHVVSVTPGVSLDQAITLMLLNDFSQVPVMSGARTVRGAVTWQSIATAMHRKGRGATIQDARPSGRLPLQPRADRHPAAARG
jgi:CBS domain-containing protein